MSTSVKPFSRKARRQLLAYRPGQEEAVNEPLYHYAATTTTISGTYSYFGTPLGSSSTTLEDTNMNLANQLPAGIEFDVRALEVVFFPGVDPGPAAAASSSVAAFINDMWKVWKAGYLQFNILAKPYLTAGPVGTFPYTKRLDGFAAQSDTSTAGATQFNRVAYSAFGGQQFAITPVTLTSNMNFGVQLVFPTSITISANARMGVRLVGIKRRLSQ